MTAAQDLEGRTAVITGGSRGLGRAVGLRLAAAGARIHVLDLPGTLDDLPEGWQGHALDLAQRDAQDKLKTLAAEIGPTAILVANAGLVPPWRAIDGLDYAEWQRVMDVNVWGAAITLGAFAESLAASRHGAAVLMASINGYRAAAQQVLYTASKHAVVGIMKAAAHDLGPRGIRVNAVAPGPIATEALVERLKTREKNGGATMQEALDGLAAQTMMRQIATEENVANTVYFLASDASTGVTGSLLPVEGGLI
ncbi:SDR family NAD(P)-dependent oxidoreductase [Paracoccus aminophilus]|uniref:3-oxoacyl-(Acyl-carrier-protein) reductase n=1 Tax=Paracoccus aminophilus JCM 7686 TaxID=1367847 RepID=S5Y512_PARAH|nr:SDR family oxidoreductase [Paracoccus aminophilus]AGT10825.1 3-oxoacyl-(acyl-carrier-protein) reductase [Paracoccus aminophilus JCM 7686]